MKDKKEFIISLRIDDQQLRKLLDLLKTKPEQFKNKSDIIRKSLDEIFCRISDDNKSIEKGIKSFNNDMTQETKKNSEIFERENINPFNDIEPIKENVRLYNLFWSLPIYTMDLVMITDKIFNELKIRFDSELEEKILLVRYYELLEFVYFIVYKTLQEVDNEEISNQ